MPTDLTIRVRDYVTREFEAGVEGNRTMLPSTYDVAKKCVRGSGNARSCQLALRHLHLLELVGEIIRVSAPEESGTEHHATFWALPIDEPAPVPVAVTVTALAQWQLDLIADIEAAEVAPSSW
jgi:hypothetical protein